MSGFTLLNTFLFVTEAALRLAPPLRDGPGFDLMKKNGWKAGSGIGRDCQGRVEVVEAEGIDQKGRQGIGSNKGESDAERLTQPMGISKPKLHIRFQ